MKRAEMGTDLIDHLTPEEKELLSRLNPEIADLKEKLIACKTDRLEVWEMHFEFLFLFPHCWAALLLLKYIINFEFKYLCIWFSIIRLKQENRSLRPIWQLTLRGESKSWRP